MMFASIFSSSFVCFSLVFSMLVCCSRGIGVLDIMFIFDYIVEGYLMKFLFNNIFFLKKVKPNSIFGG